MGNTNQFIKIVIIGAGGFGREVLWSIEDSNQKLKKYDVIGFIDENESLKGKLVNNIPVLGDLNWFSSKDASNVSCIVAIGDCKIREKIVKKLKEKNVKFETMIHPSVIHSEFVKFGEGVIIQAGSIITVNVSIGNHVHVNIDSTIGHDCVIEDFVSLAPGVHINGRNSIKKGSYVGTGTVTKEKITIGKDCIIGAGTVLISDVPDNTMFVGVPGKLKKKL
jgi:sugar O-acyltransferase (sialic acid O-acetyltransferase NeuD family)